MKVGIFEIIRGLRNKTFSRRLRGYDSVEVEAYLKRVSKSLEVILVDYQDTKKRLKKYEVELVEFKEREELLKKTLSTATKMSDKIKEDSGREAKLIISDAQHRAEMIIRDAKDSLRRIYQDISELKRVRLQFENNLKAILNSHVTMLEQGKRVIPDPVLDEQTIKTNLKTLNPKKLNADKAEPTSQVEPSFEPISSSRVISVDL